MRLIDDFWDKPGTLTQRYHAVCDGYIYKGLIADYDERFESLFGLLDELVEAYGHSCELDSIIDATIQQALWCLASAIDE